MGVGGFAMIDDRTYAERRDVPVAREISR